MGAQRVLQAVGVVAALAAGAIAAPKLHERLAVIDLGPSPEDETTRKQLAEAAVTAGFEPVIGNGIEDALAGINVDKDVVELGAAMAEAQRAFGALDCAAAIKAADRAIAIAAMRQAARMAVPELPRALTYELLCKDKAGDVDGAMAAAARLRVVGGSADVAAAIWQKYPEVDAIIDREQVGLEIETDAKDADVFIDLKRAGKAPLKTHLPAGEHLIAVAAGTKRGWAAGKTDPKQAKVTIPTTDVAGESSAIATRVASWKGTPSPDEIAWVMNETHARVVLIRRGDTVEAWGRTGHAEAPHLLGGDDGKAKATDKEDRDRLLGLITDRVQGWNDRAPDPDQPLLTEKRGEGRKEEGTKWWVYAVLAGAVVGAATVLYVNDAGTDRQRVELKFP
jgi:hypothetical protein